MAYRVAVEPSGIDLEVGEHDTLMSAAIKAGYRWPNVCGGEAMCGDCFGRVLDGTEHIPPMQEQERTRLRLVGKAADGVAHLACQLHFTGPVSVFKRGVRRST